MNPPARVPAKDDRVDAVNSVTQCYSQPCSLPFSHYRGWKIQLPMQLGMTQSFWEGLFS